MGMLAALATKLREMNVILASESYATPGAAEIVYGFKKQLYPVAQGECDKLANILKTLRDKLNDAIGNLDTVDGVLTGWQSYLEGIPGMIEARAVSLYVQMRDETEAKVKLVRDRVEVVKGDAYAYALQLQTDTTNFFNARRAELGNRIGSLEQYLPKRTPAQQAAYFKNLARPAYEDSWEFLLQNSLWNLRNKTEGSLEWDPIKAEATAKANAALAAANQNINSVSTRLDGCRSSIKDDIEASAEAWGTAKGNAALAAANQNINAVDARLAKMIADSNGKTTDLENKLPLTTAALNKRIDEANEAATEKANAALAAANQNILTIKGDLGGRLSDSEQITSDLKARVNKMEMEIDKVAPILARLPSLPVS